MRCVTVLLRCTPEGTRLHFRLWQNQGSARSSPRRQRSSALHLIHRVPRRIIKADIPDGISAFLGITNRFNRVP